MSQLAEINQALGSNSQISEHFIAIQQEQIASLQTYIKEIKIKESREQRTPEYMIYDSQTLDKVADYFSINNPRQKTYLKGMILTIVLFIYRHCYKSSLIITHY